MGLIIIVLGVASRNRPHDPLSSHASCVSMKKQTSQLLCNLRTIGIEHGGGQGVSLVSLPRFTISVYAVPGLCFRIEMKNISVPKMENIEQWQ